MRVAIDAVIIEESKLLLVKKRNSWILPGGKIEDNESELECLSREVSEELSGTKICEEKFYGDFEGRTPHRGDILKAKVYFAKINGELYGVREGDSISRVEWVRDFKNYNLSDITSKIVDSLRTDKFLE
jgi:ADP-ribose pyrophosphatase YjhB (NUDIX family)